MSKWHYDGLSASRTPQLPAIGLNGIVIKILQVKILQVRCGVHTQALTHFQDASGAKELGSN